jgi:hypothetical protein
MRAEPELLPRARDAIDRALTLGHGEAYLASAQYQFNRGNPERGAADLARALVRTPMSAQTHELAGKILVEIDGPTAARQHYETARGLDPGRAQIIDNDLARIDALEGRWDDAERRMTALLSDPDTSISQLGFVLKARLSIWRGQKETLSQMARMFMSRVGSTVAAFKFVGDLEREGTLSREAWLSGLDMPHEATLPRRAALIRLQVFTEIALAFDHTDLAFIALDRLNDRGFMDVTWLDNCPLFEKIVDQRRFAQTRQAIGERAGRVLAAFRQST